MTVDANMTFPSTRKPDGSNWSMLFLAWLIAFASTLGALYIGEVLGQTPCQLCWYQRIAMFPLAVVLGIACFRDDFSVRQYAIPIAFAGLAVALWHNLLYFDVVSESIQPCDETVSCSGEIMMILGWVPIPVLSLAAFGLILIFSFLAKPRSEQ
ncbi:MAG: disulfide bond formation protein B [Rhodospirillales bacterium]